MFRYEDISFYSVSNKKESQKSKLDRLKRI